MQTTEVLSRVSGLDQDSTQKTMVKRFMTKMNLTQKQAEELWDDTKKFLQLANEGNVVPSKIIDEAWHEFILHTKLYADYCRANFGKFIHHTPSDGSKTMEDYRLGAKATTVRAFDSFGALSQNWYSKTATCDQCGGPE